MKQQCFFYFVKFHTEYIKNVFANFISICEKNDCPIINFLPLTVYLHCNKRCPLFGFSHSDSVSSFMFVTVTPGCTYTGLFASGPFKKLMNVLTTGLSVVEGSREQVESVCACTRVSV